ncbi:hypothetical protein RND81_09G091900 [Saponaria officinalis]|uniref:Uncharacterized protein n=1 Tax=Saponaria officinalis TaxID=3572 RepID=A0AAW1IKS6_SAPOF
MVRKNKKTESTPKSKIKKRKYKEVEENAYESNKKLKEVLKKNAGKELEASMRNKDIIVNTKKRTDRPNSGSNKRLKVILKTNGKDLEISRKNTDIIEQPKKRKRIQKQSYRGGQLMQMTRSRDVF